MTKAKEFINKRKEYESADRYNMKMQIEYLISQVHTLFEIIEENVGIDNAEDTTSVEEKFITGSVIENLLNNTNELDESLEDLDDVTSEEIIKKEFENWGLKEDYAGCKQLLDIINGFDKYRFTVNSTCDYAIKSGCVSKNFKANLTFIRKKANFNNSEYLTILSRLPKEEITNDVLLKNILELCVEDE